MAGAAFNNGLWIIGGDTTGGTIAADVWSSQDGVTWSLVNASPPFGPRYWSQLLANGGHLWLIGGGGNGNDVWSSPDGVSWTQATAAAAWPVRTEFQSVVFNNKLWVIGGLSAGLSYLNDVWSSTDGINWTMATGAAAFPGRAAHAAAVFNGRMWVIGGYTDALALSVMSNDVASADGLTWTEATAAAPFTGRVHLQALVLNNQLCVVAGYDATSLTHDMWCSPDGAQWRVATRTVTQLQ